MTTKSQSRIIAIFCTASILFAQFAFSAFAYSEPVSAIIMTEGAYARVDADASGVTGLKFEASAAKETVDAWRAANYDVEFGMLIMPADYTERGELNEANVFGENAIYTYKGDTGNTEGKTYIINIAYGKNMPALKDGYYIIHGTISNINSYNLDRQFIARAYAKLTKSGVCRYVMADYAKGGISSSTRSAVNVANTAYGKETGAVKDWCLDVIKTALSYRIAAVKDIIPTAESIAEFDIKYKRALELYKSLDLEIFNKAAVAEDIKKLNDAAETARVISAGSWQLVGSSGDVQDGTIVLNQENAGTVEQLKALLNGTPNGHFVLTSDLDLNNAPFAAPISFTGTLDGRGYSIKNFQLDHSNGGSAAAGGNGYKSYIFKSNSGTIKNIGFVFGITAINQGIAALIQSNSGTLENIYVDCTLECSTTDSSCQVASLVHTNTGMIKNVVAKMELAEGVTLAEGNASSKTAGIITVYNSGAGIMENCYAIDTEEIGYAMFPWAEQINVISVADAAEITELPAEDGWSPCWALLDKNGNAVDSKKYEYIPVP